MTHCSPPMSIRALGRAPPKLTPGSQQPLLCRRNRLVGKHFPDDLLELIRIGHRRQRPELARLIGIGAGRDAERAEAVVASEIQELEQRQPRRLVDEADDLFAPTIRPRVVHGAHRRALVRGQKLLVDERQILAQRKAGLQP